MALRIRNWEKYQKISGHKAPYVQVQTDILLDMDFMGLPDRERLCFLLLLCLAGRTQNKIPGDMSQIMHLCHFDDVPNVPLMMAHGLIEEWSEEKHTESVVKEEDRKRYERERKKEWRDSKACPANVPVMSRLERERETDIETETERALSPSQAEATPKKPEASRKRSAETRGTRLPENWQPDETLQAWALNENPHIDLKRVIDSFTDYWRGKAGAAARKVDWDGTFRNWVRRESSNGKTQHRTGQTAIRETNAEARERRNRDALERALRGEGITAPGSYDPALAAHG